MQIGAVLWNGGIFMRGIFERVKGSGRWTIRYADSSGKIRYEKAGTKAMAIALYQKRKIEVLQSRKLPELARRRTILLSELLDDACDYAARNHRGVRLGSDGRDYRYKTLKDALGGRPAEGLRPQELETVLSRLADERGWSPASYNRYRSFLSLAFRLGVANGKISVNPVRLVHRRREDNARIRWLSTEEEARLRAVIQKDYPDELPAFELALNTGMRRSEQYNLTWDCVDLERRLLTVPRSKNGAVRHIPLNDKALSALLALRSRSNGSGPVMVAARSGHGRRAGHPLKTPKTWFAAACAKAGIRDFSWHSLRHTFASRLVMSGVGLRVAQELLGHKTLNMVCRYAHLDSETQLTAVRRLDSWGRTESKTETGHFEASESRADDSLQVIVNKAS
jgi:integrase